MWIAVATGIVVFVALLVASRFIKPAQSDAGAPAANPYRELREQALTVESAKVGIEAVEGHAWGAIMDMRIDDAIVTVVSFADGTASIYFSNGGGFIGGHQHDAVRGAAKTFVDAASAALPVMRPATSYPFPAAGYVAFYARTASITQAAEADEQRLQSAPAGPLAALYAAGHGVITAYRELVPAPTPAEP
jgi:hypothetical protein